MIIKIPYGKRALDFDYEENKFEVIKAQHSNEITDINDKIRSSIHAPIKSCPLTTFVNKNDRILFIVSDATRYTASEKIIPILVKELQEAGINRNHIEMMFSFGIHRPPTLSEIKEILTEEVTKQFKIHMHDAFDENNFRYLGDTERGTPIHVNKKIFEFDKLIIVSSVGYHYFAGFSGGRKSLIPGLASFATIKANHKLVLNHNSSGKNPNACIARLKDNPVHLDLMEAIDRISIPLFCINTILFEKKLIDIISGDISESFVAACQKYASHASVPLKETRELVIASCGGYPRDINVIQSHKSLENASFFCKPGGVIIFLAHCRDGWGNKEFARWLKYSDMQAYKTNLVHHYQVNGQTAYSWKLKSWEFKIIMISSIPPSFENKLHVQCARTIADAYNLAVNLLGSSCTGYIIPHAWEIIPSFKLNHIHSIMTT